MSCRPFDPQVRARFAGLIALVISFALVVGGLSNAASAEDASAAAEFQAEQGETSANDSDGDGKLDAPDEVSASVMARLLKKKIEDLSQRSETSATFANPDGTWTSKTYMAPVRVEQDDAWVDVDYTLLEQPDGSWAPKASPFAVTVDGSGAKEAVRLTYEDGQSVAITWPEDLPEPTVDGTVATYTLSDSTDLVVEVTGGGINAHIRLNEAPAETDPVFTFGLVSEGVDVAASGRGLKVVDGEGDVVGKTSPLVAWDARTDDAGSPLETVPLESTLTEVSTKGDLTKQDLELTAPEGFLNDPETQYPVIIDPSFRGLTGIRDTWVRNGDATNHSAESQLVVGKINGSSNANPAQSFLKFNTAQIAGKKVQSASLDLWQNYSYTCNDRNMNVYPVTTNWSDNMTWATRGSATSSYGSSVAKNACGTGWTTVNVTGMAQAWASGWTNEGIRLAVSAADESQSSFERRFCSMNCSSPSINPSLTVLYNTPPDQPQIPVADGMWRGSTFYANSITPRVATGSTDSQDDAPDSLSYYIGARYVNGAAPAGWGDTGCYTPWVPAGDWSPCVIPNKITDGHTYALQALAHDAPFGSITPSNNWSGESRITIDASKPPAPSINCTGPYANGTWTTTRTETSITCTATSVGAYDTVFNRDRSNSPEIVTGGTVTKTVSIPRNGQVALDFTARSKSGNSSFSSYTFGIGASSIEPVEEERTSSTVPLLAKSEIGALSAKVQWRPAGSATWIDAKKTGNTFDNVRVVSTNARWTGEVQSGAGVSTVDLVWAPNDEPNIDAPSHVESRVVFVYYNDLLMETPARSVQVVPHAFGGSFPTQDFGPGQVALSTGEFQLSETDVDVPAYSGSLTLGRSHLSLGGATTGPAGVFGPGWSADFSGPDYGVSGYAVDDRRALDGSIYITSPDGESYGYGRPDGAVGATITGRFNGLGEYAVDEDYLTLNDGGTTLSLTEADGTVTRFTQTETVWLVQEVVSAEANSTVTYAYDGTNVSWIFAPKPGGVTNCSTTAQSAGCRALQLIYTTENGKTRVSEVKLHIWNPRPDANGEQGSTAAMDTVTVAAYSYTTDPDRRLTAAWDPRLNKDDGSSLKTAYTYDTVGGKTVIKTVTPPGLKAWTVNYDNKARVRTITRPQDANVGGTDATWTVQYDLNLSLPDDGLPNLSAQATATWGQPELDAPHAGAAVFGPDQVPDASPTAAQYEYADLSYWTKAGRTTNTAAYGAGAWQIDSTRYDDKGNPVWQLSSAGKAQILAERASAADTDAARAQATATAASKYATLTVYTPGDERRVKAIYSPMSIVKVQDSSGPAGGVLGRRVTRTTYDDTASEALKPGYPTTGVPSGGFGLPVEDSSRVSTGVYPYEQGSEGQPTEYDINTTQYRYDPVTAGDGNGWLLRSPTRVKVKTGASSWATSLTRFDTEGKVIETRTPEGTETADGPGSDSRSIKTIYYSVGSNTADTLCGDKPQWAGLVCKTGPGGGAAPTTRVAGYSMLLAPTRTTETQDGATRADVTAYDSAGRTVSSATTTSGLTASDRAIAPATTTYSPDTGQVTTFTDGTKTQTSTHDTWGRVLTATDGAGSTATTAYDSAGRVKTANDGKATYTYTYNGTDSRGKAERRGLVTSVEVGKPSGIASSTPSAFTGAYDGSGALAEQIYPAGIQATWVRDLNGVETGLSYRDSDGSALFGYANTIDADGRVITQTGANSTQEFVYDKQDRLVQTKDTRAGQCITRNYEFSGDSNRRTLTTYAPGTTGACQTTTGTTTTNTFDADDKLGGDVYDKLGRTTKLNSGTGGTATIGYHSNDMVATITQGTKKQDYTLDVAGRPSEIKNLANSVSLAEATNHYANDNDSPAWTETKTRPDASASWTTGWERNVADLTGDLGLIQKSSGVTALQLSNLHGDVVATYALGTTPTFVMSSAADEYGQPIGVPDGARYGWLGAKQRDATATAGLTLMGARLYNPATGRFLTRDPVPGGNDNTFTYPTDPINVSDTSGLCPMCAPIIVGAKIAAGVIKSQAKKPPKIKKPVKKGSTKPGDRRAKNSGKDYPSKAEAERAAKKYAATSKQCTYRGDCASRDHVHVDKVSKGGVKIHTRHYYYPPRPVNRLPRN